MWKLIRKIAKRGLTKCTGIRPKFKPNPNSLSRIESSQLDNKRSLNERKFIRERLISTATMTKKKSSHKNLKKRRSKP